LTKGIEKVSRWQQFEHFKSILNYILQFSNFLAEKIQFEMGKCLQSSKESFLHFLQFQLTLINLSERHQELNWVNLAVEIGKF
jgi:hypothetical protein